MFEGVEMAKLPCVALMCDNVRGVKEHISVYIAVDKMAHCKGITGGAILVSCLISLQAEPWRSCCAAHICPCCFTC